MKVKLYYVELMVLLSISGTFATSKESGKTSSLRGGEIIAQNDVKQDRQLEPAMFCGCPECDGSAFDVYAGAYTCGERINYLQNAGYSEQLACQTVAGVEFPIECGVCDPFICNPPPPPSSSPPPPPPSTGKCGCPECDDIWNTMAGDYSCGVRIEWLQSDMSTIAGGPYEENVACSKVGSEEYPIICGKCDPGRCNNSNEISTTAPTNNPTTKPTAEPTELPTLSPTETPTTKPTAEPTELPTLSPTETPTANPTAAPTKSPTQNPIVDGNSPCGCSTCVDSVLNTFAGDYKCGDRISYLQNSDGFSERDACSKVAGSEFPSQCGGCDPDRCDQPSFNNNNNVSSGQKCGGAVDSSNNSERVCKRDLWDPTGDSTMHCFAYGGSGDPCHLSNNNDPSDGRFKDPSKCFGDTFYLWDEPDTQGRDYGWAGSTWLEYSQRFPEELNEMRARGTKVTSPMLKAGGPGFLENNMLAFFNACGSACRDPSNPAYVDVIAVNAFCGDFNGPAGCRGGAAFIYNEAIASSRAFGDLPVYITNWSRLQTANPQDQVGAIDAIDEFFPTTSNPVVERVYWFGATDFGGDSSNNFLTQVLADGRTLGETWRNKCDSL